MSYRVFQCIKNYFAIIYYKIFTNVYGRGYERYKIDIIKKKLNKHKINPISYLDERIVEIPWIVSEIKKSRGILLDAGSTLNFKYILEHLSHLKKIFITTLYPEKLSFNELNISYTYEDLSKLSFRDEYFDIITCISTLEHIGFNNDIYNYGRVKTNKVNKAELKKVLFNLKRVLKKNGKLLITIPFGKKGIYENMQQFDAKDLKNFFKYLKLKKKDLKFFIFDKNNWSKAKEKDCFNIEPNIKTIKNKKIVLSSNSIALLKLTK